ncbi:unnamed protein product [Larinioides sclopetarius]|uniref:Uncharacterized protein n=1 Tax=Larinioides sclopetarius TaxID=280406 RepID=A0AAV2A9R2_9ARAC
MCCMSNIILVEKYLFVLNDILLEKLLIRNHHAFIYRAKVRY